MRSRRFWQYVLRYRRAYLIGYAASAFSVAMAMAAPWVLRGAIDAIQRGQTGDAARAAGRRADGPCARGKRRQLSDADPDPRHGVPDRVGPPPRLLRAPAAHVTRVLPTHPHRRPDGSRGERHPRGTAPRGRRADALRADHHHAGRLGRVHVQPEPPPHALDAVGAADRHPAVPLPGARDPPAVRSGAGAVQRVVDAGAGKLQRHPRRQGVCAGARRKRSVPQRGGPGGPHESTPGARPGRPVAGDRPDRRRRVGHSPLAGRRRGDRGPAHARVSWCSSRTTWPG